MKTSTTLEIPSLQFYGKIYRVTFESLEGSREFRALPEEELTRFQDLYLKVQESPKKNIRGLKQLFKAFPTVPEITNLLTYTLLKLKKRKEAEQLITLTFHAHPNHLTAKINYADQLIRLGKGEEVAELGLEALLRERDTFHYSEFRGLMVVMGFHYLEGGKREQAEDCYQLAFQVDPLHPSIGALEKKLLKSRQGRFSLKKFIRAILSPCSHF